MDSLKTVDDLTAEDWKIFFRSAETKTNHRPGKDWGIDASWFDDPELAEYNLRPMITGEGKLQAELN